MSDNTIILPSKPRVVLEEGTKGVYEIDNLYPGYGHTLGNSLRRIILSSLPGAAVTSLKIDGVAHEFSVIDGIKEDVVEILLNIKKIRFKVATDEAQTVSLSVKGPKTVTAGDISVSGQVEVLNPDQYIAELADKNASLSIEMVIEKGLGFVPKDVHQKAKMDVGAIALDAIFTPIRRVSYEVENMRVGDNTNHNRLRIAVETDGTLSPRDAVEKAVEIMIMQLSAIVDFKGLPQEEARTEASSADAPSGDKERDEDVADILKTKIDTIDLSTRTQNALAGANIRTLGGLARKKRDDLLEIDGLGEKGIQEIEKTLKGFGLSLK